MTTRKRDWVAPIGWDIGIFWNPWISVGLHIDHKNPSIDVHLPLVQISLGRIHSVTCDGHWSFMDCVKSK